jgi:hypothetical protein
MEDEHCAGAGCKAPFKTDNYGLTTTPADEFDMAVGRRACPVENMLDKAGKLVRVVRQIEELKALPLAIRAGLGEEEVIAVVSTLKSRHEPSHAVSSIEVATDTGCWFIFLPSRSMLTSPAEWSSDVMCACCAAVAAQSCYPPLVSSSVLMLHYNHRRVPKRG